MKPKSKPPKTIDAYLATVPADQRVALEKLRKQIRVAAPEADECISYGVPSYRVGGKHMVSFGAASKHIAFYPGAVVGEFEEELSAYSTSRGTIRFQPDKPLPAALVRRLVRAQIARRKVKKRPNSLVNSPRG
jgi:uncharacterized protein YdhG (YjbR/CyaY superfamily)